MGCVEALQVGACYMIRSGELPIASNHPWVPAVQNYRPTTRAEVIVPINMRICDLWCPNTKRWNENMVWSIFIAEDADRVIQLRIPERGVDELKWILESSGEFSVQSVYHAHNYVLLDERSARIWTKLWSSNIHYRLQVSLWRFGRGLVPTRAKIKAYANLHDARCPLCAQEEETDLHVLVRCEITRLLWFRILGVHILQILFLSLLEFLEAMLNLNDKLIPAGAPAEFCLKLLAGAIFILRHTWEARNDLVFAGLQPSVECITALIEDDLRMEQGRIHARDVVPHGLVSAEWIPPPLDCVKLNVDAAWKSGEAAIAVLARDDMGIVCCFWFEHLHIGTVEEAEANAILLACKVAENMDYPRIMIESDCKLVVEAVLGFFNCPWKILSLVEDIRMYIEASTCLSVAWISRIANDATHEGAKWVFNVIRSGSDSVNEVPPIVEEACNHDADIAFD